MATGGKREGAGRKPGIPNRKSMEAITIFNQIGFDPLKGLAMVGMGMPFPDGSVPTPEQVLTAYKEGAQYSHPKRKAIEHSGEVDTGLTVQIVKYEK